MQTINEEWRGEVETALNDDSVNGGNLSKFRDFIVNNQGEIAKKRLGFLYPKISMELFGDGHDGVILSILGFKEMSFADALKLAYYFINKEQLENANGSPKLYGDPAVTECLNYVFIEELESTANAVWKNDIIDI